MKTNTLREYNCARTTVFITPSQRAWLDAEAERRGYSVSAVVRDLIDRLRAWANTPRFTSQG